MPDLLTGSLPKGDALRDGGDHEAREFGCCAEQRIIPGDHSVVATRLQISQVV